MITYRLIESLAAYGKTMSTFKHSQDLRSTYLHEAKEAGELLLQVQDLFKSEGYCTAKPLEVAGGSYSSFKSLIKDFANVYTQLVGPIPEELVEYFNESHASKCMTLARRWSDVCEIADMFSTKHTYRLSKTLEIVAWYKQKKADNPKADPAQFTCKLYWKEQEELKESRQQAKAERDKQEHDLRMSYSQLQAENELLRAKLSQVVTEDDYEKVMSYWRNTSAELEQTKKELEKAKLELAALKPKTYKFTPPTETPTRNPFVSV
jgi:hypothetical protein